MTTGPLTEQEVEGMLGFPEDVTRADWERLGEDWMRLQERLAEAERELDALRQEQEHPFDASEFAALNARLALARDALERIAQGNLGAEPWQAGILDVQRVARDALAALGRGETQKEEQ